MTWEVKGCREIQGEGDTFWKIISCQRHIPLLGLISRKGCCCPWSLPLPGRTAYLTRSLYFPYKPRWGVDILMYFKMLIEAFGSHPFQRLSWYSGQDCSVQKLGSVMAVRARLSWGSLLELCRRLRHSGLQIEMVPRRLFWGVRGSQEFSVLRWIETTYSRREGIAHREAMNSANRPFP